LSRRIKRVTDKDNKDNIKKETPIPITAAVDGRGPFRAYINKYATNIADNQDFYKKIILALSVERMNAYGDVNKQQKLVLARYMLNMALCESLYSSLQVCEVALRNSIHNYLTTKLESESWFNMDSFILTDWARSQVNNAIEKLIKSGKETAPGHVIAELHFGFWTSFFEAHYEQNTLFLPRGIKGVFPYLPKSQHNRKKIKARLDRIRNLRNRVFHHERIIHWKDLEEQHRLIIEFIGFINPELMHLAEYGDRFGNIRKEGLDPWLNHLDQHWKDILNLMGEER
jgi:hypothetical protein